MDRRLLRSWPLVRIRKELHYIDLPIYREYLYGQRDSDRMTEMEIDGPKHRGGTHETQYPIGAGIQHGIDDCGSGTG